MTLFGCYRLRIGEGREARRRQNKNIFRYVFPNSQASKRKQRETNILCLLYIMCIFIKKYALRLQIKICLSSLLRAFSFENWHSRRDPSFNPWVFKESYYDSTIPIPQLLSLTGQFHHLTIEPFWIPFFSSVAVIKALLYQDHSVCQAIRDQWIALQHSFLQNVARLIAPTLFNELSWNLGRIVLFVLTSSMALRNATEFALIFFFIISRLTFGNF